MPLSVIVLAAGKGTRMRSERPKVLQPLAGHPLLEHVLAAARALRPAGIHVVVGHGADDVRAACDGDDVSWVDQGPQLGTGHAVAAALPAVPADHTVLVLYGDVPLVSVDTLSRLAAEADGKRLALLTVRLDDPTGYGRVLRDAGGSVSGIVEEKDASEVQRAVHEVNTGLMAGPAGLLAEWLTRVGNDNAQGEYYLTDVVDLAVRDGRAVHALPAEHQGEVLGVNDRRQLAGLERELQRRQAEILMDQGVTLLDPARFDLRGSLTAGSDVVIDVNSVFEGEVVLGDGVQIGPGCYLRDCRLGPGTRVLPNTVIEGAEIGAEARIGPFARVRPETELAAHTHVGNFVEIKKSRLGEGSKVNHLSYVGDSEIGRRVNVGAGTITCNYDGADKHRTVIGDDAFIGSGVELVAPVTVGRGATIGAGSTISKDCPDDQLSLSRARQTTVSSWQRPTKRNQD